MSLRLGPLEIGIILVIVLIVFGVGKLPQVGDAIGKGLRSFRKASSGEDEETAKTEESETKEEAKTEVVEKPVSEVKTEAAESPTPQVAEAPKKTPPTLQETDEE
jgi:sec-independent protein translocase protein TatA